MKNEAKPARKEAKMAKSEMQLCRDIIPYCRDKSSKKPVGKCRNKSVLS